MVDEDAELREGVANVFEGFFRIDGKGVDVDSGGEVGEVGCAGKGGFTDEIIRVLARRDADRHGNLTVNGMFYDDVMYLSAVVDDGVKFVPNLFPFVTANDPFSDPALVSSFQKVSPVFCPDRDAGSPKQGNVSDDDLPGNGTEFRQFRGGHRRFCLLQFCKNFGSSFFAVHNSTSFYRFIQECCG